MSETTKIAWSRSTFSPWIGCTEISVGPQGGCNNCYARVLDARYKYGGATHWGAGVPRYRTAASTWAAPLRWNAIAKMERDTGSCVASSGKWGQRAMGAPKRWDFPGFWPVFPSLCDPFDTEVPMAWHVDFWSLIEQTPNLTWLLLTKRIGNVAKMMQRDHPNVWIGASIVNQEELDRDGPKLLAVRGAAKRFISYEPALGAVDFQSVLWGPMAISEIPGFALNDGCTEGISRRKAIDQIIVGGESRQGGAEARPFDLAWARSTVQQCRDAGVAPFVKQVGSSPYEMRGIPVCTRALKLKDRAGADPSEWDEQLRVQEWPK